jgi:protein-tyrosine phosphatase
MDKTKILFVCLGNICRSPSGEAVMKGLVEREGLGDNFEIDSAGTAAWHEGEPADPRMQVHANKRGYTLTSISRPVRPEVDFDKFDYIIAMDRQNMRDLQRMAKTEEHRKKLYMMTDFAKEYNYSSVPDPYYGGDEGFELVLDLLEDSCSGLLENIKNEQGIKK